MGTGETLCVTSETLSKAAVPDPPLVKTRPKNSGSRLFGMVVVGIFTVVQPEVEVRL
jgi:hypothetical protein